MAQNRVIWAVEAVGFAQLGSQTFTAAHGVQSVGITTTFNLQPVFELGQSRIYENISDIPDIEVTMEKVLDGYPPLYTLATRGAGGATLFGRQSAQSTVALSIFPDTNDSSSGTAVSSTVMSGLFVSSVGYTFPVDGNFSENVTLVGNNKVWKVPSAVTFSGGFDNTDSPLALTGSSGGVNRREDMLFDSTSVVGTDANGQANATSSTRCTILPPSLPGISTSGTNDVIAGSFNYKCSITNIAVSADLGRESLNELGHKAPYYRFMNTPVEVQTTIDLISKSGDWISASETQDTSAASTIKIATREGLWLDLGTQNKLASVNITGGEAGGGNQTISYQFSTYNDFTVQHVQDPTTALRP